MIEELELTKVERLILSNQYRILAKLEPEQAEKYEEYIAILEYGYENEYDEFADNLMNPDPDLVIVWDILDMYAAAMFSAEEIGDEAIKKKVYFMGFDGNNELEYLIYAKHIMFTKHRFGELTSKGRTDFNSHMRMLERYRKQVSKWNGLENKYKMTKDQLLEIFG